MLNLNFYKPKALVIIIVLLAISLYIAKNHWGLSISIISTISALLFIIDRWLWKYRPFSYLLWIKDFSGRYEGELEYEYRDEDSVSHNGKLKHTKIIHQTGSCINIYSFTITSDSKPSSSSESKGIYVEKLKDNIHYQLINNFFNNGNNNLNPHFGTEVLKFIEKDNEKIITGKYYTERIPFQTKGHFIELKKVNNNLTHIF